MNNRAKSGTKTEQGANFGPLSNLDVIKRDDSVVIRSQFIYKLSRKDNSFPESRIVFDFLKSAQPGY